MNIGSLVIDMAANLARLQSDMDQAKRMVGDSMSAIKSAVDSAQTAMAALGVGASLAGLLQIGRDALSSAADLKTLSEQTNVSVEALSSLKGAARAGGIDMNEMGNMLVKLQKSMVEAQDPTSKQAAAFAQLGVNVLDANGKLKAADVVLVEVAQQLGVFNASATKTQNELTLLGKTGTQYGAALQYIAEKGPGVVKVTDEQAAAAREFERKLFALQNTTKAWITSVVVDMLPALTKIGTGLSTAAAVGAAYAAAFYGVPALMTAVAAASSAVGAAVYAASINTGTFTAAITASTTATWGAITAFGVLQSAAALLFAAFAGWKIGEWLSNNFLEAQLAGIAFVEGVMTAWENLKGAGKLLWAVVESAFDAFVEAVGGGFADMLEGIANGMKAIGLDGVGTEVDKFAAQLRAASTAGADLDTKLAAIDSETKTAITSVKDITGAMADEAIAHFNVAKNAAQSGVDMAAATAAKDADKSSSEKLEKQYGTLVAASKEAIAQMNAQETSGTKLTNGEKRLLDMQAKVEAGTLTYNSALYKATAQQIQQEIQAEKTKNKLDEYNKTVAAVATETDKLKTAQNNLTTKLREGNVDLIDNNEKLRLGEEAYRLRKQWMLDDQAQQLLWQADMEGGNWDLEEQARLLKARAALMQEGADIAAAKKATDEWNKATEEWSAATTKWGEDFATAMMGGWTTFKDWLKKALVNFFIAVPLQFVGTSIAQAATGALGMGAGSGGILSSIATAGQGQGGLMGMLGSAASSLGAFGNAASYGFQSVLGGNLTGAMGGGMDMLMAGNVSEGLGMMAGSLGPYALAALAIGAIAKHFLHGGTPHSGSIVTADATGARTAYGQDPQGILNHYLSETDTALKSLAGGSVGTLNNLSTAFGGKADFSILAKYAADNDDHSFGGFDISRAGGIVARLHNMTFADRKDYDKDPVKGFQQFGAEIGGVVRDAIDTINLPQWAEDTLSALGNAPELDKLTEAANGIIKTATALQSMADSLSPLGGVFSTISTLSSDAKYQLASFAGGIDALMSKVGNYVKNYYSADEQAALSAVNIRKQLVAAGFDSSLVDNASMRSQLRGLMDMQDLTTEDGRKKFAALLNVSGDFATLSDYLKENKTTLGAVAALAPQSAITDAATSAADANAAMATTADNTARSVTLLDSINTAIDTLNGKIDDLTTAVSTGLEDTGRTFTRGFESMGYAMDAGS